MAAALVGAQVIALRERLMRLPCVIVVNIQVTQADVKNGLETSVNALRFPAIAKGRSMVLGEVLKDLLLTGL